MISESNNIRIEEEATWRSTNGHGGLDDYHKRLFIEGATYESEIREVELAAMRDEVKELKVNAASLKHLTIQNQNEVAHFKALAGKADELIISLKLYRTTSMAPKSELKLIEEYELLRNKA